MMVCIMHSAWTVGLTFVDSDICENSNYEEAMQEHKTLAIAMDISHTQQDVKNVRIAKMK